MRFQPYGNTTQITQNQTNVQDRFEELQKLAITLETYLEENGVDLDEDLLPF